MGKTIKDQALLELKNIHKLYGAVHALDGVSFKIHFGEILGLVGDNGAGKSTLIKVISGVIPYDIGKIIWNGNQTWIKNPSDALSMGIETMHQQLSLVDTMNVYENIFLGRWIIRRFIKGLVKFIDRRSMKQKAGEALDRIGISIPLEKTTNELSGGQRKAVAFAATVYSKPKLLILDEPTASLGVNESRAIINIMKRLKQQGLSMIFISHNLEEAFSICDRLVIMRNGRKVAEDVISNFNAEEVVQLMLYGSKNSRGNQKIEK